MVGGGGGLIEGEAYKKESFRDLLDGMKRGASSRKNGFVLILLSLIASAKSRSARGASHQPAFMSGCLTISHTCLPCPPGKGSLLC